MNKTKIIVKPSSWNLWWGIYGLCEKVGWEDMSLYAENGERIGGVCLNSKGYLRGALDELREYPSDKPFVDAAEVYLEDDKCYYWYFYNDINTEDFYEVPYDAPKNERGEKPCSIDIWHPDEGIGLSTIESGIKAFVKQHLGLEDCDIEIQNGESLEESIKSFQEEQRLFDKDKKIAILFSDQLIEELSQHWNQPKEKVRERLENIVNQNTPKP